MELNCENQRRGTTIAPVLLSTSEWEGGGRWGEGEGRERGGGGYGSSPDNFVLIYPVEFGEDSFYPLDVIKNWDLSCPFYGDGIGSWCGSHQSPIFCADGSGDQ